MTRIGYKYLVTDGDSAPTGVDVTTDDFKRTMGYDRADGFESRDAFLARHTGAAWLQEVVEATAGLLEPGRRVLSVGSGVGEHEVLLSAKGFDVTASDIVPGVLDRTAALFPELKTRTLDIRTADIRPSEYDDIIDTGILFYYDNAGAAEIFRRAAASLKPGGRLLSILRYNNNPATWFIDRVMMPLEAALKRALFALRGDRLSVLRKAHGFRRSRSETVRLAREAGFEPGRVRHAGFGMELTRSAALMRVPGLFRLLRRLDRGMTVFNNATVFEFRRLGVWLAGLLNTGIDAMSLLFEMDAMGIVAALPL